MVALAGGPTERVGRFDFEIRAADRTAESDEKWMRRSDTLAAWLMHEWQRERAGRRYPLAGQSLAERN